MFSRHTLPIPKSSADFELQSLTFARAKLNPISGDLYGSSGQDQRGVDAIVRFADNSDTGIQSKRYYKKRLTPAILQKDLDAAHGIEPALTRYIVTTTKDRDTTLSDWARSATINGHPAVEIWFWDEFAEWIFADPVRKSKYLDFDVLDHATGLSYGLNQARAPTEILAYAAGGESDNRPGKSRELLDARAQLVAGRPDIALATIQALLGPHCHEAGAWRVAAAAHLQLGDPVNALRVVDQADAAGCRGGRLEVARANALTALGRRDAATEVLERALPETPADERHAALGAWLTNRLEVERLSHTELLARVDPADITTAEIALPLANAAAFEGDRPAVARYVDIVRKTPNMDRNIAPLLTASATVIAAQNAANSTGGRLHDADLRADLASAIALLRTAIADLSHAPYSNNRTLAWGWLARGLVLLDDLNAADEAFVELLIASRGAPAPVELAFAYGTSFRRAAVVDALCTLPATQNQSVGRLLRAERAAEDAPELARAEFRALIDSLPAEDEWFPYALASAICLPFDATSTPECVDRAEKVLAITNDPDAIATALATAALSDSHESVRARMLTILRELPSKQRLTIAALAHIVAMLRRAEEHELQLLYGDELNLAIDDGRTPPDRATKRMVISEMLERLELERAERLIVSWFPEAEVSRESIGLRYELAWRRGDLDKAYAQLSQMLVVGLATSIDVLRLVTIAADIGRLRHARRLLRENRLPEPTKTKDIRYLDEALLLVNLNNARERLLQRYTEQPGGNADALAATLSSLLQRRQSPKPPTVAEHTMVVMQGVDPPDRECRVWITPQAGDSAPEIERVTPNEPWVAPLLGSRVDDVISVSSGLHAGTWRIADILPGSEALHRQQMQWAQRVGIQHGGVDVVNVGNDPVEAIRRRLDETAGQGVPAELGMPILCTAYIHEQMPLAIMARHTQYRLGWGSPNEVEADAKTLEMMPDGVLVDPLTLLLLENYGITSIVAKAAGSLSLAPQSRLLLLDWWRDERQRRHGAMSTGLTPDRQLVVQEHDVPYRKRRASFWRGLASRTDIQVLTKPFLDSVGAQVVPLARVMGSSGAVMMAYAQSLRMPILSIDSELVRFIRSVGIPAVSLTGILARGRQSRRITPRESASVKGAVGRDGWTFVQFSNDELTALIRSDDDMRDSDFHGIMSSAGEGDLRSALQVVTAALNRAGPDHPPIGGEAVPFAIFRCLPDPPEIGRKDATSHVRQARHAWYSDAYRAWLSGRLRKPDKL
jgi:tetratricopeptide (TPR) repeat protein